MINTQEELLIGIEIETDDNVRFQRMLIYADYLEEQGDPTSVGWRWITDNRFMPYNNYGPTYDVWTFTGEDWRPEPDRGDVPNEVWKHVNLREWGSACKEADSRISAEIAVAKAVLETSIKGRIYHKYWG